MALTQEEIDFLEQRKQALRQQDQTAADTIDRMSDGDPDRVAEENQLSNDTGIPVEAVQYDIEAARKKKRRQLLDLDGLAERSPKTAEYFKDPSNAAISYDDVENFEKIEALAKESEVSFGDVALTLPAGAIEQLGMGVSGVGQLYNAYARSVNRLFRADEINTFLFGENREIGEIEKFVLSMFDFGGSLKGTGKVIKKASKKLDLTEKERASLSYWQNVGVDVTKGTGQVAGQILTAMVNPIAGTVNLLGQGAEQAAERQIESSTLGQGAITDAGIFVGAAITAGTEKVGIDQLINRIPPKIKNSIFRNTLDVLMAGGIEALQEIVEGILQGVNEIVTSNPDVEIFEGLDREGLAAGGTGIVARTFINMLTPGKGYVDPSFNATMKESYVRVTSEAGQSYLDERISLAQSSNTNERDKARFEEWINTIDPEEFVFIRPEVLTDMQDLPDYITEQLDGTGASVSVPMGKFLTDIVKNEEMLEQIRPYVTIRENHQTQLDLDRGPVSASLQEMITKAQENQTAINEADEIYEQVKEQLVGTLRQGEDTARMSAQLLPAMIVTQQANLAARGIEVSVEKLYADMGLRVVGPEAPGLTERDVMSQDIYDYGEPNLLGQFPVQKVGYKRERIDDIIFEYEGLNPDETNGFIVMVDPKQFIPASTPDDSSRMIIGGELTELDPDRLARMEYPEGHDRAGDEIESPYLEVAPVYDESGKWEIVSHQGRHRMASMAVAGYTQVPVVISMQGATNVDRRDVPEDIFDDVFELQGQYNPDTGTVGIPIQISNPIALTRQNREQISEEYGVGADNRILMQRDQKFGDLKFTDVFEQDGQQYEATTQAQKLWELHQERLTMVEALRKCLS